MSSQASALLAEVDIVVLIKTPSPVPVKLLPTNVAHEVGVLFDILVPLKMQASYTDPIQIDLF